MKIKAAFAGAALLVAAHTRAFAQDGSYHYRFDYWPNRAVRILNIEYPQTMVRSSALPFTRQDVSTILESSTADEERGLSAFYRRRLTLLKSGYSQNGNQQRVFELSWRNTPAYSDHLHPNEKLRLESDLLGFVQVRDGLAAYFDFQFDTDGIADSDYHGTYEWKDVVGDMRAAYFQYTSKKWSLLVGRDFVHWGPGSTGALLTSGYAPSLDMIKLTLDLWKFRFQGFNALLNRGSEAEDFEKINRYFSGHRLSFRSNLIELGINETILYGGPREVVSPIYLNPLIPYYFADVMMSEKRKDNVTLSFEATFYWPQDFRFYGQYLVDEYYYEGEHYPKRTGLLLGADWIRACGSSRCWLNLEYVRIDRWVYNYEMTAPWNRLNYYNSLLGHPMGPDGDLIHVAPELYLGHELILRTAFDYYRHGETTVSTPLNTEEQLEQHHVKFPFGVVEKTASFSFEFEYAPSVQWLINLTFQHQTRKNVANVQGVHSNRSAFLVRIQHNLHKIF